MRPAAASFAWWRTSSALPNPSEMEATLLSGGILSYAVVPLMAEGELIGFPNLGSDTTGGFSREHCGIALELGDVLAVAIDQSLTEAQLRRHLEESQRRLSELTSQT